MANLISDVVEGYRLEYEPYLQVWYAHYYSLTAEGRTREEALNNLQLAIDVDKLDLDYFNSVRQEDA